MMSEAEATAMSDDIVEATVSLKLRSCSRMPPARKQQPRTSRMLDRILPSMLDWTIRISPCLSATMETCHTLAKRARLTRQRQCARAHTHNQLDGVSKRRIHQPTQRLAQLGRQLLGRKAQEGG